MKKKVLVLCASIGTFSLAFALFANLSEPLRLRAMSSPATNGTWVHYARKEATRSEKGIREYWAQCGTGTHQFTLPSGDVVDNGSNYDTSEFTETDDRWIFNAEITDQDLDMSNSENSISLGSFGDATISSITLDGVYVGTDPTDLDLSSFSTSASHGEKETVVDVTKDGREYALFGTTTLITDTISSVQEFSNLLRPFDAGTPWSGNYFTSGTYVDGYYVLTTDLSVGQNIASGLTESYTGDLSNRGFRGTFDGRGHTLNHTAEFYNGGLFNVLNGATIKNFNIVSKGIHDNGTYSSLAVKIYNSTLSNLSLKFTTLGLNAGVHDVFTVTGITNSTLTNVTVDATGLSLNTLFNQYASGNTCSGVLVFANDLTFWKTSNWGGTTGTSSSTAFTGCTFIDTDVDPTPMGLDRQDIVVNTESTSSLSLGAYSSNEWLSISTVVNGHTYSFGTDATNLLMPSELVNTPQDHGPATLKLMSSNGVIYTTEVTFVTKVISDATSLENLGTKSASKVYGYYIVGSNFNYTHEGNHTYNWNGSSTGFYGTLDGRGKTITIADSKHYMGFFGTTCDGAVIKDLTIKLAWYSGEYCSNVFGYTMYKTTLDNVTIQVLAGNPTVAAWGLIANEIGGCYFNKVTITSPNNLCTAYKSNVNKSGGYSTFTNCSITGKNVYGVTDSGGTPVDNVEGWTITRTGA